MRRLALLLLVVGASASADTPAPPVLHEYVAPPHEASGDRVVDMAPAPDATKPRDPSKPAAPPPNPVAIRDSSNKLLLQPPLTKDQQVGEPFFDNVAPDRETRVDYDTRADSNLRYAEVFNPSVVPFMRLVALNSVRNDYTMIVHGTDETAVPVGGAESPDRDLFWGSLVVHLGPDQRVAIPSVAPDMRVLSYETEPPVSIHFSHDAADNYYARADGMVSDEDVRLVFLVDAPQTYFAPAVPPGYTLRDLRELRRAPPLPPRAEAAAEEVIDRIGVHRDGPLDEALDDLVAYFRSFQAGEAPEATGDIYRDLAFAQRGVCRHRAFAFMVTADALGIPSRYVENEAHAFAEVWVPERGWLRIDLGGAADTLDVANEADKSIYRPRGEDPFPKPPAYRDNYTKLRGDVRGLSQDQLDDAQRPLDPTVPHGADSSDPVPAPGRALPRPPASAYTGKTRATITVDVAAVDKTAFRGEAITVSGHVRAAGKAAPNLRVEIYLQPQRSTGDTARDVGETITDDQGAFSIAITLPRDLGLEAYLVYAGTPGDATVSPALSD